VSGVAYMSWVGKITRLSSPGRLEALRRGQYNCEIMVIHGPSSIETNMTVYARLFGPQRRQLRRPNGKYVTFSVSVDEVARAYVALDVKPLEHETDPEVISWCAWQLDRALWEPTILKHLRKLTVDAARHFILEKQARLSTPDRLCLLDILPPGYRPTRVATPAKRDVGARSSRNAVKAPSAPTLDRHQITADSRVTEQARPAGSLVKSLSDAALKAGPNEREKLLSVLAHALRECTDRQLWARVPDAVVVARPIWSVAPEGRKLEYLSRQTQDRGDPNSSAMVQQIAKLLARVAPNETGYYVSLLPDWARQHRLIAAHDLSYRRRAASIRRRAARTYGLEDASKSNTDARLTYCWSCETDLDSREQDKCAYCRWLICPRCYSCSWLCPYSDHSTSRRATR
jgi:hypothetical protein